jgi:type VI secretion system (T6SS) effector TldE1-like protein
MASHDVGVEVLLARGRFGRSEAIALVLAALAVAAGAAAWVGADADRAPLAAAALPSAPTMTFESRFGSASSSIYPATDAVQALDRFASRAFDRQLLEARASLVRGLAQDSGPRDLSAGDFRPTLVEGTTVAMPAPGVPLPRPRPVTANLPASLLPSAQGDANGRADDRSLLQKLSDLLPSPVRLASLGPDGGGGLVHSSIDLGSFGYDRQTAVYDITAKMVYLPSGIALEAHSGMGDLRDDPDHVSQRMVGATPPATYELKPREKLFHGVRALRMTAVEGSALGRSGLLTHSYMLGPEGDSNGCVSIKNYDRFVKAYDDGEITRLVVVTSLEAGRATRTAQKSPEQ